MTFFYSIRFISVFLFLFCFYPTLEAQHSGSIRKAGNILSDIKTEYFIDLSKKVDIQEVRSPAFSHKFQEVSQKTLNLGYKDTYIWCRFKISNLHDENKILILAAKQAYLDTVIVYIFQRQKLIHTYYSGDLIPVKKRPLEIQFPAYPLDIPQYDSLTIYLQCRSSGSIQIPIEVWPLATFLAKKWKEDTLVGIVLGFLLMIALYNMFLAWWVSDKTFLYYALCVFFMFVDHLALRGYLSLISPAILLIIINSLNHVLAGLAIYSFNQFTKLFLKIKPEQKFVYFLVKSIDYVLIIQLILFFISFINSGLFVFSAKYTGLIAVMVLILNFIIGLILSLKKNRQAYFFIIAHFLTIIGVTIYVFKNFGLAPQNLLTNNIFLFANVMEVFLLALGIVDRIKTAEKNTIMAQEMTIKALIEKEDLILWQNQMLENKVSERTKEINFQKQELVKQADLLTHKNKKLVKLNHLKDKILSIVSHDFRGPLATSKSLLEMIQENGFSKEELDMIVPDIRMRIDNTLTEMDNVLLWAKGQLESGGLKLHPTKFNLYNMANECLELLLLMAQNKQIEIVNSIHKDLFAYADSNMIKLVMRNLLSNALKFSYPKGKVIIGAVKEEEKLIISIRDHGMGISKENQTKMFNNKIHYTTYGTDNEKGTGLGLLLCKDVIVKSQGEIWVESEENKGAVFYFTLVAVSIVDDITAQS